MRPIGEHPLVSLLRYTKRNGECLEWTAALDHGYGAMFFWGQTRRAHRVSWALVHGEWPQLHVCHHCDNPRCIRPSHLFLGTDADNIHDMDAKGRRSNANRATGERNGNAALSRAQVRQLRHERRTHGTTYPKLARMFGISTSTAHRIATERTRAHD